MKRLILILMIGALVFSSSSCLFRNEVKEYAESLNLSPVLIQELKPLGKGGMDGNEKILIDEMSILPQGVQTSETALNLLREIVQDDKTITGEELNRFGDLDEDGLTNQQELEQGTVLLKSDSDADGLKDGEEFFPYRTDPLNSDSDWDGLKDKEEVFTYTTNPLNRDTDEDGISDSDEIMTYGTSPLIKNGDTDRDRFSDAEEISVLGSNLLDKNDPFTLIEDSEDSDGDGVKDCDDPEPLKANLYKETVSWLSEKMKEDASSCINKADKVQTFKNLLNKVYQNVPHAKATWRGTNNYPNAKWDALDDCYKHPRDILMNYYSYHQKVQLPPDCDDVACVYDIMADYIIAQSGWDEEGESQGNNGVDCDAFLCIWGDGLHLACIINIEGVEYMADPSNYYGFFKLGENSGYLFPWDNGWKWDLYTDESRVKGDLLMAKFDKRYTDSIYNKTYPHIDAGNFWEMMRNQTPENESELRVLYAQVKPSF